MRNDHLILNFVSPEKEFEQGHPGSPASSLSSLFADRQSNPLLVLLTGDSGVGKTTWCLQLIDQARQGGIHVTGLVSPIVLDAGHKVGIDLMEVSTGECRRLALHRQDLGQKFSNDPGTSTMNWTFDPAVFAWGNQILVNLGACELLVLDELGPLELSENKGLIAGLKCIDDRRYQTACVVIRPSLLSTALERWPWGKILRVTGLSTKGASE
jgi:nucleoside-triphosphatase